MHATRVAVYFSPHLNTPALRQRKISIIVDDDSHTKLSHHKQVGLTVALVSVRYHTR